MDKEEIPNEDLDDEALEPWVEIQDTQEMVKEVTCTERTAYAVIEGMTGGFGNMEARSLVIKD